MLNGFELLVADDDPVVQRCIELGDLGGRLVDLAFQPLLLLGDGDAATLHRGGLGGQCGAAGLGNVHRFEHLVVIE